MDSKKSPDGKTKASVILLMPRQSAIECTIDVKQLKYESPERTKMFLLHLVNTFGKDKTQSDAVAKCEECEYGMPGIHLQNHIILYAVHYGEPQKLGLNYNDTASRLLDLADLYGPIVVMRTNNAGDNVSLTLDQWNNHKAIQKIYARMKYEADLIKQDEHDSYSDDEEDESPGSQVTQKDTTKSNQS